MRKMAEVHWGSLSTGTRQRVGPLSLTVFPTLTFFSIFERLKQLGYERDVEFSGRPAIRKSKKSLFNTTRPLTDKGCFSRGMCNSVLIFDMSRMGQDLA